MTYEEGGQRGTELRLAEVKVVQPGRAWAAFLAGLPEQPIARFGAAAELLGFELRPGPYTAGDRVPLLLRWRGLGGGEDRPVALQLVDSSGGVVAEQVRPPVDGSYPMPDWAAGQLVRDAQEFRLPRSLPAGTYRLRLGLAAEGAALETMADLGPVEVRAREASTTLPPMAYSRQASLGGQVELLGYDLEPSEAGGGQELRLKLHWRALNDVEDGYKVFTHLVGPDGRLWGQHDSVPCNGRCPTSQWGQGEVQSDEHLITVTPGAPAGEYRLLAGMYDPRTGQRLASSGDAAIPADSAIDVGRVTMR